jgi:hypothetical protein
MQKLVALLTAMTLIATSPVSTAQNGKELFGKTTTTGLSVPTATKSAPVHVKSLRIPKPKVFRANPHRIVHYSLMDDQDDIFINDDDIYTGYRRKDLTRIKTEPTTDDPDGIITEEIRWKLFLARTAAMIRYQQIHS